MFGSIGGPELMVILVIALLVFGPRKLNLKDYRSMREEQQGSFSGLGIVIQKLGRDRPRRSRIKRVIP